MNIVLPMAGRGSRFANTGIGTPKPLIDVKGKPMYSWAMDSLPLSLASKIIFICLEEHLNECDLEQDILQRYSDYQPIIISLNEVTEGQACTVLKAKEHINTTESVMIYNADTYLISDIESQLNNLDEEVAGVFSVFEAEGDKWSFAKTDETGNVIETSEKVRISPYASTGLYHFSSGAEFVYHTESMIQENDRTSGEFYIAPVYNRLIAQNRRIVLNHASKVWVLGTPEDLGYFNANYE